MEKWRVRGLLWGQQRIKVSQFDRQSEMKTVLGSQHLTKCNFCFNWFDITNEHAHSIANLQMCISCFERAKKDDYFRITHPKKHTLYRIHLKKSYLQETDLLPKNSYSNLVQMAERYEALGIPPERMDNIKSVFSQLMDFENVVRDRVQPVRDFINRIFKNEISRIETVWEDIIEEINSVYKNIEYYKQLAPKHLSDESIQFELKHSTLEQLKKQINTTLESYNLEEISGRYQSDTQSFYKTGFKLFGSTKQYLLTERSNNVKMEARNQYFTSENKPTHKRTGSIVKRGTPNQKQNKQLSLERHVSEFIKSPRTNQFKYRASSKLASRKQSSSVDSCLQSDDERRQKTKTQIKELLKNKAALQTYKPNNEKSDVKVLCPEIIMKETIYQALETTFMGQNILQLVAYNIQNIDFQCYLEMIQWTPELYLVRFVKVGLGDDLLNILLCYTRKAANIDSLILTNNLLTDSSIEMLVNYFKSQRVIRNIYLGRNYIQPFRVRQLLGELRQMGVNILL